MYRVTPLDNHLLPPYELLYGCKPKTLMSSSKKDLQSRHPNNGYMCRILTTINLTVFFSFVYDSVGLFFSLFLNYLYLIQSIYGT